jgi:hypothetical protein
MRYLCIAVEAENRAIENNKEVRTCIECKYLETTFNRGEISSRMIQERKIMHI